jgi:cytochrome P450
MTAEQLLRPLPDGIGTRLRAWAFEHVDPVFGLLRTVKPILRFGDTVLVTRYDDVREVFLTDDAFPAPYKAKLDVIMGECPFFLGMGDTDEYRRDTAAMRKAVLREDIPVRLAGAVDALAEEIVKQGNGQLEIVDGLVRRLTFKVMSDYFGVPDPPGGDLRVWATRLFEFQFADPGNDPSLRADVDRMAPALRSHIDGLIAASRQLNDPGGDVLGRCIALQRQGEPGFSDQQIRTALMGFIVGGPPQPPMVVPQALEQLLRRPEALMAAQAAARTGDDALLAGCVFEAMRFDPLAPALMRKAARDHRIAVGTRRETVIPKGATVLAAIRSAMHDNRRVPDPKRFDPHRMQHEYINFGHGLHTCFGIHMNRVLLPLMLKPLLRRNRLRRAPGPDGHLTKRGPFADRLGVVYDA